MAAAQAGHGPRRHRSYRYCDSGAELLCHYIRDLIAPTIAFVVGASLLSTTWRIRRDPPALGPLVTVGALVGVAVASLPILLIVAVSRCAVRRGSTVPRPAS